MESHKQRIVFLGSQGSGKGTQAELLAVELKLPIIATGVIYRDAAKKRTVLGEQVASYVNQGKLVPDDITNALIKKRLAAKDCRGGFILDGYPRTLAQAQALAEITALNKVILVNLSDREAIRRIAGRFACQCGATYHQKFNPPRQAGICDKCGQALFVRKDDQEERTLRQRLSIYREQIDPLIKFYQAQGILAVINGEPAIEAVHQEIKKLF